MVFVFVVPLCIRKSLDFWFFQFIPGHVTIVQMRNRVKIPNKRCVVMVWIIVLHLLWDLCKKKLVSAQQIIVRHKPLIRNAKCAKRICVTLDEIVFHWMISNNKWLLNIFCIFSEDQRILEMLKDKSNLFYSFNSITMQYEIIHPFRHNSDV